MNYAQNWLYLAKNLLLLLKAGALNDSFCKCQQNIQININKHGKAENLKQDCRVAMRG